MWYSLQILNRSDCGDEMRAIAAVTADSRWFAGHFPGNPILPGIAQVDMVMELVAHAIQKQQQKQLSLKYLSRIKFKRIIRPGESLELRVLPAEPPGLYSFRITHHDEDVCSGMIFLEHNSIETGL